MNKLFTFLRYLRLLPLILLVTGYQFYRPGQISQKVFGGLGSDDAILSVPTPYGRAVRVSGASTNNIVIHPDGTISKFNCNHPSHKP